MAITLSSADIKWLRETDCGWLDVRPIGYVDRQGDG